LPETLILAIARTSLFRPTGLPVYALGGMTESSLSIARQSGGQGIAAIRAFWD